MSVTEFWWMRGIPIAIGVLAIVAPTLIAWWVWRQVRPSEIGVDVLDTNQRTRVKLKQIEEIRILDTNYSAVFLRGGKRLIIPTLQARKLLRMLPPQPILPPDPTRKTQ